MATPKRKLHSSPTPAELVVVSLLAPEEVVLGLYQAINPNVKTIWEALIIFNIPFTFIKKRKGHYTNL